MCPTQKNFLETPSTCLPLFNSYAPLHKFCACLFIIESSTWTSDHSGAFMSAQEHLWELRSIQETSWALMKMVPWYHEYSWVFLSAHKPRSWEHMSSYESSWVLMALWHHSQEYSWLVMAAHGCLCLIMSDWECSWLLMSTHDSSWVLMSTHDRPFTRPDFRDFVPNSGQLAIMSLFCPEFWIFGQKIRTIYGFIKGKVFYSWFRTSDECLLHYSEVALLVIVLLLFKPAGRKYKLTRNVFRSAEIC